MKLLINKSGLGSEEIQQLTGSYYANNEFNKIQTDWLLTQESIMELIGSAVLQRAIDHYHSDQFDTDPEGSGSEELILNDELVKHIQLPVAYLAAIRYYESNLVSHEDQGRKVKIDNENEKMAWEWMLDRDDAAHRRKANETIDRLLRFLETNKIAEWLASDKRKLTRKLFINTAELFNQAFPIDHSTRFFYTITPFIAEVQNRIIKKALGKDQFKALYDYWQNFNVIDGSGSASGGVTDDESDEYLEELLNMVQLVMPLFVMTIAVKRLAIQVLPDSVVQRFHSMMQSRGASQAALPEVVKAFCVDVQEEAAHSLDDIKQFIQSSDPEAMDYPLIPTNDESNKYFRS